MPPFYRINELRDFISEFTLFPSSLPEQIKIADNLAHLERVTRIWPLVNSDSALYSLSGSSFGNITKLISQAVLDEVSKTEIKSILSDLVLKESNGDPLPWSTGGRGGKPPRKNEQYKRLWQEVAELLEAHSSNSPAHRVIYDDFLTSRGKNTQNTGQKRRNTAVEIPVDEEPVGTKKVKDQSEPISLFDIFSNKEKMFPARKFYGQQTERTKVQLYPKMGGETDQAEGMRKDGSDALENKNVIEKQVK